MPENVYSRADCPKRSAPVRSIQYAADMLKKIKTRFKIAGMFLRRYYREKW
jgi:hypothetical protein